MREIKFRGIDLDGNFRYGFFKRVGAYSWIQNEQGGDEAVIQNTVGQFTGLKDKNGKEIYEGDILKVCNGSINGQEWLEEPYAVEYILNRFSLCSFCWQEDGSSNMDSTHWCEVIGNIHQDPDLLK